MHELSTCMGILLSNHNYLVWIIKISSKVVKESEMLNAVGLFRIALP
jgi:hypothetical protein